MELRSAEQILELPKGVKGVQLGLWVEWKLLVLKLQLDVKYYMYNSQLNRIAF